MNPPVKDAGLRLGWLLAREPLGLLIGLAVAVVFGGGLVAVYLPTGPAEQVEGEAVGGFIAVNNRAGTSEAGILALVEGRRVRVTPYAAHACALGDRIVLQRIPRLIGPRFTAAADPCAPQAEAGLSRPISSRR